MPPAQPMPTLSDAAPDVAQRALYRRFRAQRFAELVGQFEGAPVRGFVPVLVRRQLREQLRSSAH